MDIYNSISEYDRWWAVRYRYDHYFIHMFLHTQDWVSNWRAGHSFLKRKVPVPGNSCRQEEPRPDENTRICPKIFDLHHAGAFVKFVVVTTPRRRNESWAMTKCNIIHTYVAVTIAQKMYSPTYDVPGTDLFRYWAGGSHNMYGWNSPLLPGYMFRYKVNLELAKCQYLVHQV